SSPEIDDRFFDGELLRRRRVCAANGACRRAREGCRPTSPRRPVKRLEWAEGRQSRLWAAGQPMLAVAGVGRNRVEVLRRKLDLMQLSRSAPSASELPLRRWRTPVEQCDGTQRV